MMSRWHALFGNHSADLEASRWQNGRFVTDCTICGVEMIKHPGGQWKPSSKVESMPEARD